MQKAFVLDKNKQPLMPCHPARARWLLKKGKAAVFRLKPFTVVLLERDYGDTQPLELKFDAGSKVTGIALVVKGKNGCKVIWAANLEHRGQAIRDSLLSRRAIRKSRRNRKTRYRAPRFLNRTRPQGWLAPSLKSRVDNIENLTRKLIKLSPIDRIASERVRFDMQKLRNPEIDGVEYQQGSLFGFEVKEYLLHKWQHRCVYCDAKNVPLEIEHVVSKSTGGSDSVTNLVIACRTCNEKKSNLSVDQFLKGKSEKLKKIKSQIKAPLKDAAAINTIRFAIGERLEQFRLPLLFGTGGQTKFNRTNQGYPKDHWIDAVCVGRSGELVSIPKGIQPLIIKAKGRGCRQMCRVNKYGFPRTSAKKSKVVKGFVTGDLVKAIVTAGRKVGTYTGRVSVRFSGSFDIKTTNGLGAQGISWKYCRLIQKVDGYLYN
ncbi:MAG: RNA-guided endonuclease IscB [Simkaniaceae bacterium]|nr:RNA-guided endonuclease IscB [Simkaniaceae bacterium]